MACGRGPPKTTGRRWPDPQHVWMKRPNILKKDEGEKYTPTSSFLLSLSATSQRVGNRWDFKDTSFMGSTTTRRKRDTRTNCIASSHIGEILLITVDGGNPSPTKWRAMETTNKERFWQILNGSSSSLMFNKWGKNWTNKTFKTSDWQFPSSKSALMWVLVMGSTPIEQPEKHSPSKAIAPSMSNTQLPMNISWAKFP